ncbi:probable E3 ubiquitin-protein ligase Hul5p [[Candida] jaroonii]|uniref:Probable E3 ubiquitin-protein ligase Hul5p n=1 Tax=[Candida] jaroonii TaxID=467808 RepID=A0ACA9Y0S1_9ASCO|nr:probable E3 ubiquitin-protein ligase Hul5p [[Candida] jaroonii]
MINFTGQTRKRNVNLGDKRQRGIGTTNYLEKTKLQRQQREAQRSKDKSGLLIQKYVIRYLHYRRLAEIQYDEWVSRSIRSQEEFNEWVVQLFIMTKWKFPYSSVPIISTYLNILDRHLTKWELMPLTNKIIMKSLLLFLKINDGDIVSNTIRLIESVIRKSKFEVKYPGFINSISEVIDNDSRAKELIMSVNVRDSKPSFLLFLANIDFIDQKYIDLIREVLSTKDVVDIIDGFTKQQKVSLLILYMNVHGDGTFYDEDYISIGNILTTIPFSVVTEDEDLMEEDEVDDEYVFKVPNSSFTQLSKLYEKSFVQKLIDLSTSKDTGLAINIISKLFHLLPDFKSRLSVSITIIPGSYKWFFNQIQQHNIYKLLSDAFDSKRDYVKYDTIMELYEDYKDYEIKNFWNILYTFEELYSYWLIVSNDLESFDDSKLSLEEASYFLKFLRTCCLTLIFINDNNKSAIANDFDKLKEISITLLNQLYLKNLRLKFLPKDFWQVNDIVFNLDVMLQIIGDEEERRIEELDEDEDGKPIKKINKRPLPIDTLAKLEILNKLPFFLKFNDRVQIFQSLIDLDRQRSEENVGFFSYFDEVKVKGEIRRQNLLEDAYKHFGNLGGKFKKKIGVSFIDQWGRPEEGIDGGGLTKEFLNRVVVEGFSPNSDFRLFKETSTNQLYPNDEIYLKYSKNIDSEQQIEKLKYLKFLGSIIGKCLYESVLIDVSFAPFFLNKWCTSKNVMKNSINDLRSLDEELFLNLMKLTKMNSEELEFLDLDFTIDEKIDGKSHVVELMKNAGNLKVTTSNKLNYIHQIANFKLNTSLNIQSKYFLEGLCEIISADWLKMFDFNELQMLISGSEYNIDLDNWKQNVEYGGYLENDLTIKYFWEVIEEMTPKERSKLLKFVTSVARPPLLGFEVLNPKFGIRNSGREKERLPTASTCVNLLKLPDYQNKELIRSKLLYVIEIDSGFGLS